MILPIIICATAAFFNLLSKSSIFGTFCKMFWECLILIVGGFSFEWLISLFVFTFKCVDLLYVQYCQFRRLFIDYLHFVHVSHEFV